VKKPEPQPSRFQILENRAALIFFRGIFSEKYFFYEEYLASCLP